MTATTEVGLYNLALSLIGSKSTVSSTSEASREAETCLLWFDDVRNRVLHAAPWPSAASAKRLNLLSERDVNEDWEDFDPPPGWRFAFDLPSDLLRPQYLSTYERFAIGIDQNNNKRLFSNAERAILIYTKEQTTITAWDHGLKMAIVHALAAYINMPLNGKLQRAELTLQLANGMILEARTAAANSQETQLETVPDWISARGYAFANTQQRFVYPFGPLLTMTGAPTT